MSENQPSNPTSLLFRHRSPGVDKRDLRRFLNDLTKQLLPGRSVTCLIASDANLRELNRKFRGQDHPTDVLSFPPEDIAISFDRAAAQAAELRHSVEDELRILMLHGLLHLTGMDHETDSGAMKRTEARWRKRLGLPSGLIERVTA
ncbi:MAG TPA: rRNA maturation RNase YbeY [Bryobacteraceae bacterium]|nr:rRNA maturation RNase YbeY [Bryobacteraceae bacterium]